MKDRSMQCILRIVYIDFLLSNFKVILLFFVTRHPFSRIVILWQTLYNFLGEKDGILIFLMWRERRYVKKKVRNAFVTLSYIYALFLANKNFFAK
ncbi:hypothetical protein C2G38_647892 [Gigaspora rosea]|uniref:Uncharacterized protein n=1 Tax=Gigaspora rosea TaxID=44941 RepID=A0A397W7M9_9GLOM|nr:hypothetical protein C2G38_647892 [Gigaspora rosea]